MTRKLYFLIIALYLWSAVSAQHAVAVVVLNLKNTPGGSAKVFTAVNNTVFWASQMIPINRDGSCIIELNEGQTGYITIRAAGKNVHAFIQKGDSLKVEVDTLSGYPIRFEGNCADGQRLLSDNYLPSFYTIERLFSKDTTLKMLTTHIEEEKKKKLALFTSLYNDNKINKL